VYALTLPAALVSRGTACALLCVVDLSHHDEVADFGAVKAAGIAGIIHKATEGVGFT
jgi:GH25 family lysozyme M1 (1,4-beta-N-acetylmuramidase)